MNCHNSTRKTLTAFVHSFHNIGPVPITRQFVCEQLPLSRSFSFVRPWRQADRQARVPSDPFPFKDDEEIPQRRRRERPAWQVQKEALREKLGGETWKPRKKLSPDAMEGVRHLHASQPDKFSTPVLAEHFKVSPDAIRRILKSNWRPSDPEAEERRKRWEKRGERIWSNLVELGVKPPKQWRDMGVGRAQNGEKPRWKSGNRNLVDIRDSVSAEIQEHMPRDDIIPTVDGNRIAERPMKIPFSKRL